MSQLRIIKTYVDNPFWCYVGKADHDEFRLETTKYCVPRGEYYVVQRKNWRGAWKNAFIHYGEYGNSKYLFASLEDAQDAIRMRQSRKDKQTHHDVVVDENGNEINEFGITRQELDSAMRELDEDNRWKA